MSLGTAALAVSILSALLYVAIVALLGRRKVSEDRRGVFNMFRLWWAAAAVVLVTDPVVLYLHRLEPLSIWQYQVARIVQLLAAAVAAWSLLCYLVYMYRGDRRWWRPLTIAYGLLAVLLVWMVLAYAPERLAASAGEIEGEPDDRPAWIRFGVIGGLLVPLVAAILAYLRLLRVPGRTSRYRVGLVGASLLVWLLTNLVLRGLAVAGGGWELFLSLLGLVAPILVLAAYFPPAAVRRRWGIDPI